MAPPREPWSEPRNRAGDEIRDCGEGELVVFGVRGPMGGMAYRDLARFARRDALP